MNERDIEEFWNARPCGEALVTTQKVDDFRTFFDAYDLYRYATEGHILECLDGIDFKGRSVLEVGLGQAADSEQIIRRGAAWSGMDITDVAVARARLRMQIRDLPFQDVKKGSVLAIPYPDESFDIVFSHVVLHHVTEIHAVQTEIGRVLRPGWQLVVMVYAKYSLNYLLSIAVLRRLGLIAAYLLGVERGLIGEHVRNARREGLLRYLSMDRFIHRNTDGPKNPYSKVYDVSALRADFPDFEPETAFKRFMHAPPLPVHGMPGGSLMGWHLWAYFRKPTK